MAIMEYFTPTHVYFGVGAEDNVGEVLKEYGANKVLVHFGSGSVRRTGLLDDVEERLKEPASIT
jgi:alcohol dehydrogenase YqhD (iron-dependent ADH family)